MDCHVTFLNPFHWTALVYNETPFVCSKLPLQLQFAAAAAVLTAVVKVNKKKTAAHHHLQLHQGQPW